MVFEDDLDASWRERLRGVVVHSGGQADFAIPRHGVCRHGDDPNLSAETGLMSRLSLADAPGRLQPVHHRHLHVHQHEFVGILAECLNGFLPVRDDGGRESGVLQVLQRDLLVHAVVLGHQDARLCWARGAAGLGGGRSGRPGG